MYSDDDHTTLENSDSNSVVLQQVKVEFATFRTEARQSTIAEKEGVQLICQYAIQLAVQQQEY
jgi:hypothetical protein